MSLPVTSIFKESFNHVWKNKLTWLKIGVIPLVFFAIAEFFSISLIFIAIYFNIAWAQIEMFHLYALIFNGIFSIISGSLFYFKGYRYGILNEGGQKWWSFPLKKSLFRMMIYLFFIGTILGTLFLIEEYVFPLVDNGWVLIADAILILLVLLYVSLRLSLLFPLIALGNKKPLRTSWILTKAHVFSLISLAFLMGLAIIGVILVGFFFIGLINLVLINTLPIPGEYSTLLNWLILGKIIVILISLPIVGIGLEGLISFFTNFLILTILGFIDHTQIHIFIFTILDFLLLIPLILFIWAVFTKAFSLIYLVLREERVSSNAFPVES